MPYFIYIEFALKLYATICIVRLKIIYIQAMPFMYSTNGSYGRYKLRDKRTAHPLLLPDYYFILLNLFNFLFKIQGEGDAFNLVL